MSPPGDTATSLVELKTDAAAGNPNAQTRLGLRFKNGDGVERSLDEAIKWFQKAADQDYLEGELQLAIAEFDFSDDKSRQAGLDWMKKSAEHGYARSQSMLGLLYETGTFVPKDLSEAARWYRKAAEKNEVLGVMMFGLACSDGDGVPKNEAEGLKWLRISAEQDNPFSQLMLGLKLGLHTNTADKAESVKWFRLAAEQGEPTAQNFLGTLYQRGLNVPKDPVQAFKWLKLASDQTGAQRKIPSDVLDAMTPKQLAEASRLAASFVPRKSKMLEIISAEFPK